MAVATNPLVSLSNAFPTPALKAASLMGRILGAGLCLLVALDQSYDPTQVFTLMVAAIALLSLAEPESFGQLPGAFAAGVVFFAGTVLTHLDQGIGLLAMGLVSGLATLALAHRRGRDVTLPGLAFLSAAVATALLEAAIVFLVE